MSLCACGCGQETPLAPRNEKRFGHVKGEPMRFVRGHNLRGHNLRPERVPVSHDEIEDDAAEQFTAARNRFLRAALDYGRLLVRAQPEMIDELHDDLQDLAEHERELRLVAA